VCAVLGIVIMWRALKPFVAMVNFVVSMRANNNLLTPKFTPPTSPRGRSI
jgi:hypothetical protein